MITNISECMSAILKEARDWPVVALVESFRALLQKSICLLALPDLRLLLNGQ